MAEFRQIYCHIWRDNWFIDLTPEEKLLYIYLFSNSSTSASGIYEMPLKVIAFETGIPQENVLSIISEFQNAGKVYYEDGVIWIPKMRSYQESSQSPKLQKRIQQDIDRIPSGKIKSMYLSYQKSDGKEITDRVSIPYPEKCC